MANLFLWGIPFQAADVCHCFTRSWDLLVSHELLKSIPIKSGHDSLLADMIKVKVTVDNFFVCSTGKRSRNRRPPYVTRKLASQVATFYTFQPCGWVSRTTFWTEIVFLCVNCGGSLALTDTLFVFESPLSVEKLLWNSLYFQTLRNGITDRPLQDESRTTYWTETEDRNLLAQALTPPWLISCRSLSADT